jgi:hypothetical protein
MGTAETVTPSFRTESLGPTHWVGVVAALVSGAVHLYLGVAFLPSGLGVSFLLAGAGFVGAVVLVDYRRRLVYAVGVPFTLVQIVLWYVLNFGSGGFPGEVSTLGAVDKVAQVALLASLVVLLRR